MELPVRNRKTFGLDNILYDSRFSPQATAEGAYAPLSATAASSAKLLEAIELLPQPLRITETLHLASKLVEQAAYELVRNTPSDQVLPLFTIAARLEKEAKRILDNAT